MNNRLIILDLYRFLAAFSVVIYHYIYRGWMGSDGLSVLNFNHYDGAFKYGYLGVQFFFMISGFVILKSSEGKSLTSFIIGRISRLYPAYWMCCVITALFILILDDGRFSLPLGHILLNLTMISKLFGIPFLDGAYWTLIYELVFYFYIALFISFNNKNMVGVLFLIMIMNYLLIYVGLENKHLVFTLGEFLPYFLSGMIIYKMSIGSNSCKYKVVLCFCIIFSLVQSYQQANMKNYNIGSNLDYIVVFFIIGIMYASFILLKFDFHLSKRNENIIACLGALTYPCYLLHQNIGYIIFNYFGNENNQLLVLFLVLAIVLTLSYIISHYIEPKVSRFLRTKLNGIILDNDEIKTKSR